MRYLLFVACLLCFALAQQVSADDRAGIRAGIDAGNRQWIEAWGKADADLITNIFAPDGVMLRRGGDPVSGHEALRAAWKANFAQNGPAVATVDTTDFWEVGDRVYETGEYTYTFKREGAELKVGGRYLTIWKKQADGAWKIIADLGFPDRAVK